MTASPGRKGYAMRRVDGQQDPVMRLVRALAAEGGRRENERYLVEGPELIRRALDARVPLEAIVESDAFVPTAEGVRLADAGRGAGVALYAAAAGLLGKMVGAKPIPGCLAVARRTLAPVDAILAAPGALIVAVERGESADNLGMLLRSMDAAGVSGVLLTADGADPFSRRAVRGSRGAVFTLPMALVRDLPAILAQARALGIRIVATSAGGARAYTEADYRPPTVILVGNEHAGLSPRARELADLCVRIPMRGRIHSLNIAVAASVMAYEAVRQRTATARTPRTASRGSR